MSSWKSCPGLWAWASPPAPGGSGPRGQGIASFPLALSVFLDVTSPWEP